MLPYEPTDENHILPFYMKNVIPAVVIKQTNGIMNPFVLIFNKGVIQGSIYEGPFTKNDKCALGCRLLFLTKLFTVLMKGGCPYACRCRDPVPRTIVFGEGSSRRRSASQGSSAIPSGIHGFER